MKTIEQQKAELCDELIPQIEVILSGNDSVKIWDEVNTLVSKYNTLTAPKESTNPYIDEVFDMRICNVISEILNQPVKKIRLSDCPHISKLDKRKNIGFGSIQAYESIMQKYELNDKLI